MELNTTQKLCDFIAANYPSQIDDGNGPLDAAVWFCCIQEAKNLCGLNLKDLASVVMNGMRSYTDDADNAVQQWLDTYAEYISNSIEEDEEYTPLEDLIKQFYETGE